MCLAVEEAHTVSSLFIFSSLSLLLPPVSPTAWASHLVLWDTSTDGPRSWGGSAVSLPSRRPRCFPLPRKATPQPRGEPGQGPLCEY